MGPMMRRRIWRMIVRVGLARSEGPPSPQPLSREGRGRKAAQPCSTSTTEGLLSAVGNRRAQARAPLPTPGARRGSGGSPPHPKLRNNQTTSGSPRGQHENEIQYLFPDRQQPDGRADVLRPAGQRGALRPTEIPDLREVDREATVVLLAPGGSGCVTGPHRLP